MTKVKPEEKVNPTPTASSGNVRTVPGSGTITILPLKPKIGDIFGNFILLGPLEDSSGLIKEHEVWVDMRTITTILISSRGARLKFEGKVDLNHPVSNYSGWLPTNQLTLIP